MARVYVTAFVGTFIQDKDYLNPQYPAVGS